VSGSLVSGRDRTGADAMGRRIVHDWPGIAEIIGPLEGVKRTCRPCTENREQGVRRQTLAKQARAFHGRRQQ
jgi:hypothetical protein